MTAVGSVRRRRVLGRAGARPNDGLYLSGSIGGAAAALEWLQAAADGSSEARQSPSATLARYRRPAARVRLGAVVGRSLQVGDQLQSPEEQDLPASLRDIGG